MVIKNLQARNPTIAEVEMAVRAVEGVPNAMDMDFADIDPDPTSLDLAAEDDSTAMDERWPDH